jgi:peptidase E
MLDDFVLSRARRTPARVCFVPTASADSHSARAYRVEAREGRVSEQVLSTRFLGAAADAREATS